MRGIDIRKWGVIDWTGAGAFAASALIPAVNSALKDAPELAAKMPAFLHWSYLPLVLLLVAFSAILYRLFERHPAENHKAAPPDPSPGVLTKRPPRSVRRGPIVGPFHVVNDPPAEFRLLPLHYLVDLAVPLPYVQATFYGVNFLTGPVTLTQARLSIRLYGAAALEAIPPTSDDAVIDPKFAPLLTFRRNLSDAETRNLPWRAGRETASFELSAKADDGEQMHSYAVGSQVIEGWVSFPSNASAQTTAAGSATLSEQDFIPLHDAAAKVYEALKKPPHIWTILADNEGQSDEGAILNAMAYFIAKKIPLYGRQPPKSNIERLDINEQSELKFEEGGRKLHFPKFRMPPCVDLHVRPADVGALVESQRGLYVPRGGSSNHPQAPAVAPLDYQRSALEQVVAHLRRSGVKLIQLQQLGRVIADSSLRDGVNPIFEPLSLETTQAVVTEFVREGKLRLQGDAIAIEDQQGGKYGRG